ncbi:MAG: ABC transporter ATP-binding protein [Clostridia bacterium]|jgi:ATP-binding cassette subfamily B multidrug efflux pump|nr:ABC transporter ATP-binding protein [Clostridia bacterium]
MKHLFSCIKPYRAQAVLAPLFKLFEAAMELLVPLVVAAIVKNGVNAADKSYILYGCLILVGFGVAGLAFSLTAQYFAAKAAVSASAELRARLFAKLQSFPFETIDKLGTSAMITRLTSDVNQVQTGINMTLRLLLRSPIVVVGATAMAFLVDVPAGWVFVSVIPLLAVVVMVVLTATVPLYRRAQEKLDKVNLSVRENLTGVRVVRAFCMEETEQQTFEARNRELRAAQKRAGFIAALTNPLTYALISLAVIALLWVGASRVNTGLLYQSDVMALYSYISIILVELVKLANLIFTVSKAVSCQKRVGAVLDMESERAVTAQSEEEKPCALAFEHVGFTYAGGGAPALKDISFSLTRGQTLGVLGGTGSGKSTLAHLIPRFYEAGEGRVLLGGKDVRALPADELRERVGIVLQHTALFRGTVRSNLQWGKDDATDEELSRAVFLAQAEDVVNAKGGLDGEIAQEGRNLSGGQRQRLSIARALVKQPEVLILDDSSSALDYATDAALRKALASLDCTKVIVSQRATSLMHADIIIVLEEGAVAGRGTHEELLQTCPLYREIYQMQTEERA